MTPFEALKKSVAKVGDNQSELARICGVSQNAVWKWIQSTKQLPAEHVIAVEKATGVSRHDLRPDIYPRPLNFPNQVSDMDCGEYGNRTPVLDKQLAGA